MIGAHEPWLEPVAIDPLDERAQIRLDRAVERMGLDVRDAERRQRARILVRREMSSAVSVIIPTRDRGQLLVEAVRSVFEAPSPPAEVIVVDAGSTDGSIEALDAKVEANVEILRIGPNFAAAARNAGAAAATGDFLGFLDSDDLMLAGKTTCLVDALVADPSAALVHGTSEVIGEAGEARPDLTAAQRAAFTRAQQLGTSY